MAEGIDYETALLDPASVFAAPEDVLDHPELSREQKVEILRRWEYDASEMEVAEEEGMRSDEPSLVHRIVAVLDALTCGVSLETTPPTKQGGIPKRRSGSNS